MFSFHRPPLAADLASSKVKGEEHQEPADMHQCRRSADFSLNLLIYTTLV